jgi:hypothetical protein
VTTALPTVRDPQWVENQTGFALAILRKHYERWMPDLERHRRATFRGGGARIFAHATRTLVSTGCCRVFAARPSAPGGC